MKEVLIVEKCPSRIKLNESSASGASKKYILEGTFTELNVLNRNNRIYTKENYVPHVEALMEKKNNLGVIYGEFDHPEGFEITLARTSHTIESLKYDESSNSILGSIKLLNNYFGKEARALVDDDNPLFVSSRASGITEANQLVQIRQLFTYDLVADPGFASAKVNLKNINEQFGLPINEGYTRIYDFVNENSMHNFMNDNNNNEVITKKQLQEYTNYLGERFKNLELQISKGINENIDVESLNKMIENYENVMENMNKLTSYIKYLSNTLQVVVNENNDLKKEQTKVNRYNSYIGEKLEKTILFAEHIAENLKVNTEFTEYIAENLELNNNFTEYIAENTSMSIKFSEHIAENLKITNEFAEYVAENVKDNINYFDYITENAIEDKKYIAYLAQNVDGLVKFGVNLTEKLNSTINENKVNEDTITIDSPVDFINTEESDDDEIIEDDENNDLTASEENPEGMEGQEGQDDLENEVNPEGETTLEPIEGEDGTGEPAVEFGDGDDNAKIARIKGTDETGTIISIDPDGSVLIKISGSEEQKLYNSDAIEYIDNSSDTTDLLEATKNFISQVKKRETSKIETPHFFNFLNESQIADFNNLSADDQAKVKVAINESEYFTSTDIMRIIEKTLSKKELTKTQRIVNGLPEDLKPIWESLSTESKNMILNKSKFFNVRTDEQIANFWESMNLSTDTKINESKGIDTNTDELTNNMIDSFKKKFEKFQN